MVKLWADKAWEQYVYWQSQDRKTLRKINELIKDIERNGLDRGIGKPEKLKYCEAWSRRIDDGNRLLYCLDANGNLFIVACKGHYEE